MYCHQIQHGDVMLTHHSNLHFFPTLLNLHHAICFGFLYITKPGGPGSSVGIATDYGLDGPESNPHGDEIFCPSSPALGPTQPPV